jgi:threonine dehydratase
MVSFSFIYSSILIAPTVFFFNFDLATIFKTMIDRLLPELSDIVQTDKRIESYIHRTPVLTSVLLNRMFGSDLYFKCENFQKVGAFKFRGAVNAVFSLPENILQNGVVTHSSGNFAAALSLAAKIRGTRAYIVMPDNSPIIKQNAVAGYGAEFKLCTSTLEARKEASDIFIREKGARFIHPYDEFEVICGQGTAGLELINEFPDLDIIVVPVGGGGLISGIATAVKGINPEVVVLGAEPSGAGDAAKSFRTGDYIPTHKPKTIADGLLTTLSQYTFRIIRDRVDSIITVSEASIVSSMRLIFERLKIVVEPSAAVSLALIMENQELFRGKRTGLILSGGNVDLTKLPF